jgi:hypothetical protein
MKIAICISGGLRTFLLCYKTWEKFEKLGEVDYFISTWSKPCYTQVKRFEDIHAKDGDTIYSELLKKNEYITHEYLNKLLRFKCKSIVGMDQMDRLIDYSEKFKWNIMNPSRLVCQYFLMKECNYNLSKVMNNSSNNIKYDIVVKTRPDITIENIPENIDPNKIYVNKYVYQKQPSLEDRMINEMIYIANPENMNKICNIYDNFEDLWAPQDAFGERMSYKNFEKEGLLDKIELFEYGITVKRENGNDEYM